jgi:hypothetical protein
VKESTALSQMSQETKGIIQRFSNASSFLIFFSLWHFVTVGLFLYLLTSWVPNYLTVVLLCYEIALLSGILSLYKNKRILVQCCGLLHLMTSIGYVVVAPLVIVPLLSAQSWTTQTLFWALSLLHTLLNGVLCVYWYYCSRPIDPPVSV